MRKNKIRSIIALFVMTLAIVLMYLYLTYGQQAFSTRSVLVANMDIEAGTVIDPSIHFSLKNINNEDLIPQSMGQEDIPGLTGMAASQFIPQNSQVSYRCFDKSGIVITEDKFVYKIPSSWIYAVPSSIRRGDSVLIYEIDSKIDQKIMNTTQNAPDELAVYQDQVAIGSQEPIIETTVIYVKDSANREVVDVDGKKRLDGTSQVSSIEIVCTRDDVSIIEKKIADGKKLILVYR